MMITSRELRLGELLLALHEVSCTMSPQDFRHWTLREVRQLLDFDFAIWGGGDGLSRIIHTVTILDQTPDLFDTWEPIKYEDQFANLVIGNTGRSWTLHDLPKAFLKTRAYNEHWRKHSARQMLSTMEFDTQTDLHVFLTLCRDKATQPFTSNCKRLKKVITHHLFLAARHNEYFVLNNRSSDGTTAIIDRFGKVHSSGVKFGELVEEEWCSTARRKLPIADNIFPGGFFQGEQLEIRLLPLGDRYIAQARPISPLERLSKREYEIAELYAHGSSHKAIAKKKNISPNTVRNHLQSIYFKLKIRDKAQLARLLP